MAGIRPAPVLDLATMYSDLWQSTIFRFASGAIGLATVASTLYFRWWRSRSQKVQVKKALLDVLESMLQQIKSEDKDKDLLIEYQFELLFSHTLPSREIMELTKLPSPLRMIALRSKAGNKIKYANGKFELSIDEKKFRIIIAVFDLSFLILLIILISSAMYWLTENSIAGFAASVYASIMIFLWMLLSDDFYSARSFSETHKNACHNGGKQIHQTEGM